MISFQQILMVYGCMVIGLTAFIIMAGILCGIDEHLIDRKIRVDWFHNGVSLAGSIALAPCVGLFFLCGWIGRKLAGMFTGMKNA